jgi:hypothetical protein
MKVTLEATADYGRSTLGAGRIWRGTSDQGTPVECLVAGMRPDSDDPAVEERFERERDALPEAEGPICPDCGEPMVLHGGEAEEGETTMRGEVDLFEVVARWLMASDSTLAPPGVTAAGLAAHLKERLEKEDNKATLDRLLKAARAASLYIIDCVMHFREVRPTTGEVGHA